MTSERLKTTNDKIYVDICFLVCFGVFHPASYSHIINSKITTMTYYIYQRSAYGFVTQLGFAFDKSQAIEKAKRYATNLAGDFAIEVHANGVKSEKVFDSKLWFNI